MLAFAIDLDGNESYQIIVQGLNTNISKNLSNCLHASPKFLVAPDVQWIAIEAEAIAKDRSIYVMPVNRPRKTTTPALVGGAREVATQRLFCLQITWWSRYARKERSLLDRRSILEIRRQSC